MMFRLENSILNTSATVLVHYTELFGFHETVYAEL